MRIICLLSCALLTFIASASAAEFPAELQGVWAPSKPNGCLVPNPDDVGEFPFLIVTPRSLSGHELDCNLDRADLISSGVTGAQWKLSFICQGEGEFRKVSENWHLKRRITEIWNWRITQKSLVVDGAIYQPCALAAQAEQ